MNTASGGRLSQHPQRSDTRRRFEPKGRIDEARRRTGPKKIGAISCDQDMRDPAYGRGRYVLLKPLRVLVTVKLPSCCAEIFK